jgi:hypothetical protein
MWKIILITLILLVVAIPTYAGTSTYDNNAWCSIGVGKESFSIGYSFDNHFGIEVGFLLNPIFNKVSYSGATSIVDHCSEFIFGFDTIWYPIDKYKFYIGSGLYSIARTQNISTATEITVDGEPIKIVNSKKNTEQSWEIPYSIGYQFQIQNYKLGVSYHTIKGYNLQLIFN